MQRNVFVSTRAIEWLQYLEAEERKPEGLKCIRSGGIAIFVRGDEKAKQHTNITGMGAVLQAALDGDAERLVFSDFTIVFEGHKLCKLSKPSSFKGRRIKLRNRPRQGGKKK